MTAKAIRARQASVQMSARSLRLEVDSGEELEVRRFAVREGVSSIFQIDLTVVGKNPNVEFEPVVGHPARFTVRGTNRVVTFAEVADVAYHGAMLPPDDELIEELLVPTYAIINGKIKVMGKDEMKKQLGRSPDRADALGLTFAPDQRSFKLGFV